MGGLMAIALLLVGKIAFIDPLKHDFSPIAAPETINFRLGPVAAPVPARLTHALRRRGAGI